MCVVCMCVWVCWCVFIWVCAWVCLSLHMISACVFECVCLRVFGCVGCRYSSVCPLVNLDFLTSLALMHNKSDLFWLDALTGSTYQSSQIFPHYLWVTSLWVSAQTSPTEKWNWQVKESQVNYTPCFLHCIHHTCFSSTTSILISF